MVLESFKEDSKINILNIFVNIKFILQKKEIKSQIWIKAISQRIVTC